jgi:anti-sigma B factor antagonist
MTLSERRVGDVTLLEPRGRLVFDEGDTILRTRVNELVEEGRIRIIVSLRDVTYIDSCGVGVLIAKYLSVRRKGGDLKLLCLSPRCQRVIEISGLLNVFQTFDAEDEAVASFAAAQEQR